MDGISFLSTAFSDLTQDRPIEWRLRSVLCSMKEFLNLESASIALVKSGSSDNAFITSGVSGVNRDPSEEGLAVSGNDGVNKTEFFGLSGDGSGLPISWSRRACIVGSGQFVVLGAEFQAGRDIGVKLKLLRSDDFEESEIGVVGVAIPHIKIAINRYFCPDYRGRFDFFSKKLLSRFRVGIITINEEFDVISKSGMIDEFLEASSLMRLESGKLVVIDRGVQKEMGNIVNFLYENDGVFYKFFNPGCVNGVDEYMFAISKNYDDVPVDNKVSFNVFIFSSVDDFFDTEIVGCVWNISPAEKRILSAMMKYDNVKKVAIELDVSVNTVKAQLKSVYRKMGIASKAMLIKKLYAVKNMDALLS